MAFYKMPSGHFAYVINESGNKQLVTQEQFEACCCPAPCTCPCAGSWPPLEWPCGGLLETYTTSGNLDRTILPETNFSWSGINVTATSTSCTWEGSGTVTRTVGDGDPEDVTLTIQVYLDTVNCRWVLLVQPGGGGVAVGKGVGPTAAGSYAQSIIGSSGTATVS